MILIGRIAQPNPEPLRLRLARFSVQDSKFAGQIVYSLLEKHSSIRSLKSASSASKEGRLCAILRTTKADPRPTPIGGDHETNTDFIRCPMRIAGRRRLRICRYCSTKI